jgi:catechol 2,3-dioxygenase-like lactoylglutathione lyase family enzyme
MQERIISGIQQVGIGVTNADEAFQWYKDLFGFDIQVFAEAAEAPFMVRYTGGEVHKRYAILAINLQGGGGLEIWQYTSRTSQPANEPLVWGKPGILSIKIRCRNVHEFYKEVVAKKVKVINEPRQNALGKLHFYLYDPYGNIFEIVEDEYWFTEGKTLTGGVVGVTIGVSDMERSIGFYKGMLDLNEAFYSEKAPIEDWNNLPLQATSYARCLLVSQPGAQAGAFGKLLGSFQVELVQSMPAMAGNLYDNRFWGDLGFIHICFDIKGYDTHTKICKNLGHPLTIDSGDFNMGDAAGRFSYNEDPDGTLLEYVETYKVPILKKLGWFLNLKHRAAAKHLPDWMVKSLRFSRVK